MSYKKAHRGSRHLAEVQRLRRNVYGIDIKIKYCRTEGGSVLVKGRIGRVRGDNWFEIFKAGERGRKPCFATVTAADSEDGRKVLGLLKSAFPGNRLMLAHVGGGTIVHEIWHESKDIGARREGLARDRGREILSRHY